MINVCVLLDKFCTQKTTNLSFKFGGAELFLEDLIYNSPKDKINFKYLISLENYHEDILELPIEVLKYNQKNIEQASKECNILLFWGRVLDAPNKFNIKTKILWIHNGYNTNHYLEKAQNHATQFVAVSKYIKNFINVKNCKVINIGIDKNRYNFCDMEKNKIKKIFGFEEEDFIIGNFCRLSKVKNIPFLINAISKIDSPKIKLFLIGNGPESSKIIDLCEKKLPKRFQYLYYTDPKVISCFYKILDLFCLTSLGEGYARVQFESMMFKVPFASTKVGGAADDIIDDYNGFIINEEKDLEKIIEKIKNKKNIDQIISNAYNLFLEKGSIEKTVESFIKICNLNIYNKIL